MDQARRKQGASVEMIIDDEELAWMGKGGGGAGGQKILMTGKPVWERVLEEYKWKMQKIFGGKAMLLIFATRN